MNCRFCNREPNFNPDINVYFCACGLETEPASTQQNAVAQWRSFSDFEKLEMQVHGTYCGLLHNEYAFIFVIGRTTIRMNKKGVLFRGASPDLVAVIAVIMWQAGFTTGMRRYGQ